MFNQEGKLIIDLKIQERLRQRLANAISNGSEPINIKCIRFGDSHIDYDKSFDFQNIRVPNSPYHQPKIKHNIVYEGLENGLTGVIKMYKRFVDENGNVSSYYDFPNNNILTLGVIPPRLNQAFNSSIIEFDKNQKQGWICFFETLPDFYFDANGNQLRLKEPLIFDFININNQINIKLDEDNNSFLITTNEITIGDSQDILGEIDIQGEFSSIKRKIIIRIK